MKNSIIIPAYNTEKYLEQCVSSVLSQKYSEELEVILVDDGSTDATPSICDELAERDSRITVIHQKNAGPSSARNAGMQCAKGEYIFFLDSDDFWGIDQYETICKILVDNKPDLLLFSMDSYFGNKEKECFFEPPVSCDDKNVYDSKVALEMLLENKYSFGWCPVWYAIKSSMLRENDLKFPIGYLCEDVYFSFRLWLHAKTVCFSNKHLYNYRRNNENSITHIASYKFSNDLLEMCLKNYELIVNNYNGRLLDLLKLNIQTLIEVVLFHYSSYNKDERATLKKSIKELSSVYTIDRKNRTLIRRKEKITTCLIRILGIDTTAYLWKLKRLIINS